MAQNIDLSFFRSLQKNAFEGVPKLLDELDLALEHVERPVQQTLQMISEMHGAYNGASSQLAQLVEGLGGKFPKIEKTIQNTFGNITNAVSQIENIIQTTQSLIGRINNMVGSSMDAATLRAFVCKSQSLNPKINQQIQQNIGQFPYFQQISESVGMFYNITLNSDIIDPYKWLNSNYGRNNNNTNSFLRNNVYKKMFRPISDMVEDSGNLLNARMLRCSPINDCGLKLKNYSTESPKAHGYNNSMDVFHKDRMIEAQGQALMEIVSMFQDKLKLLNTYFPVTINIDRETSVQEIQTEHGPLLVDEHGREFQKNTNDQNTDNMDALAASDIKKSILS